MSDCKSCNITEVNLDKKGVECGIVNEDPLLSGNCTVDENGNVISTPQQPISTNTTCITTPIGIVCPNNTLCTVFDLSNGPESCLIADVIEESLNIGGADINVYKMLGVHEQGSLMDQVGSGAAIASSFLPGYEPLNAFNKFVTEWRSAESGSEVLQKSYIGYDFGPILLENGRVKYGIETYVKKDVTKIKIKQGCADNRVIKARLERSSDGQVWYGVATISLPDCDNLVTISVKRSVPSRWWRLRPIEFNGGPNDYWSVQALQLIDYEETSVYNIQDRILLENRDIEYTITPISLKAQYTPQDVRTMISKWGGNFNTNEYVLEVSFNQSVRRLGRPLVIGDIIEIPSETQYTSNLTPVKKYLEVQSVGWSVNGYTPNWKPTLQTIVCVPALASRETQDVFGKITQDLDTSGLSDIYDGTNQKYQDIANISQTIKADANTMVPEDGTDFSSVPELSQELLDFSDKHPFMNLRKFDRRNRHVYGVDAMPPNGIDFTTGDSFPENPVNGDYHRLTYTQYGDNIPAKLYRWSSSKKVWIYLEKDKRAEMNNGKSLIEEFKKPSLKKDKSVSISEVEKNL